MNKQLQEKLKSLPKEPGVYFHKDAAGQIIYVGKAARLNSRVRQYFQASRGRDPKTVVLVSEIADTDWMVVDSELEALFVEAEMVRRYMPRYNILLRDDKSMSYIRIDYDSPHPTVTVTRRPLDDGARYFGPYLSAHAVRVALRHLRKAFPFSEKAASKQHRTSLYVHMGLDPGLELGNTTLQEYRAQLRKLIAVIEGRRTTIIANLQTDMQRFAAAEQFEQAAKVRNQITALQRLGQQVIFSDKEFLDISKDHALTELVDVLGLASYPRRIEGYDISHMQGSDVVASMVVFTNGVSDKAQYRKFKTKKDHNNDFYNMHETITRRLSPKNIASWGVPSLLLIDGGKGQLDAALRARDAAGQSAIPCIGLAKREEQIVIDHDRSGVTLSTKTVQALRGFVTESTTYSLVNVPQDTHVVKLLQRIRDESHRFAVSYHTVLKRQRQTRSELDDVPGIGPATKKKLLRAFGSLRGVSQAHYDALLPVVGSAKARVLVAYFATVQSKS